MSLVTLAMQTAYIEHKDQKRKYTGSPYFTHLCEVAGLVASVYETEVPVAVSFLHDIVEDQGWTRERLVDVFGDEVADGVLLLSDTETGNRKERKEKTILRLAPAFSWVQSVKCADIVSNTSSIAIHDPNFAVLYCKEIRALLKVLTNAHPILYDMAVQSVTAAERLLK